MTEQTTAAKVALADTFKFYLLAHNFHLNVEGIHFAQFHKLFQKIYEEVFDAFDPMAEFIRAMSAYAPASLSQIQQLSGLQDVAVLPDAKGMVARLLSDNDRVISSLRTAMITADAADNVGFSNFLQERIAQHEKHAWMLRVTLK